MSNTTAPANADCKKVSFTLPPSMVEAIDARAEAPEYGGNRSAVLRDILGRAFGLRKFAKGVRQGRPLSAKE